MIIKIPRDPRFTWPLEQIRVIDGDTIEADILLPFDSRTRKRIRLIGWWAPELGGMRDTAARTAAARLESWLANKAPWLLVSTERLDRYGRVLGHLMHDNRLLSPLEVLGDLQMTATQHKEESDRAKRLKPIPARNQSLYREPAAPGFESAGPL